MDLKQKLLEPIAGGFAGLWVESHEHEDAVGTIRELLSERTESEFNTCEESGDTPQPFFYLYWDPVEGLVTDPRVRPGNRPNTDRWNGHDLIRHRSENESPEPPSAAISALAGANMNGAEMQGNAVLVLRNLHLLLGSGQVRNAGLAQTLLNQIEQGQYRMQHIVVLSRPGVEIPPELSKHFVRIQHDLPTPEELYDLAAGRFPEEDVARLPERDTQAGREIMRAASGMTRMEAMGAFGLSLARYGTTEEPWRTDVLWEIKESTLRNEGAIELLHPSGGFDQMGGLHALKDYYRKTVSSSRFHELPPKGLVLMGVPGCGKSAVIQCMGYEAGAPTVRLDIGSLMGGLVGQTEEATRRALATIDAMARDAMVVVMVDEVEKGLAGSAGQGSGNDTGVGARMLGTLLTWLQERKSYAYPVVTANNMMQLLRAAPEIGRAGRFDALFFVDVPGRQQKDEIWNIYTQRFQIPAEHATVPGDENWTGAEIEKCCREAARLEEPLTEAAQRVLPVVHTSQERIKEMRDWASGRCLSAEIPGRYDPNREGVAQESDTPATAGRAPRRQTRPGLDEHA